MDESGIGPEQLPERKGTNLILEYLEGRNDIPEPTLSTLRKLAAIQQRTDERRKSAPATPVEGDADFDATATDYRRGSPQIDPSAPTTEDEVARQDARPDQLRDLVMEARRFRGTLAKIGTSDWRTILAIIEAERDAGVHVERTAPTVMACGDPDPHQAHGYQRTTQVHYECSGRTEGA
jgi:hypothetical protein